MIVDASDLCVCLDVGLGKTDAQMVRLGQLVVVHLDQCAHGLLDRAQLYEGHLVVFPVGKYREGRF